MSTWLVALTSGVVGSLLTAALAVIARLRAAGREIDAPDRFVSDRDQERQAQRGLTGIYHHVSEEHLYRYLSEFDFRYNTRHATDAERTRMALLRSEGKRLMYADSIESGA